MLLHALPPAPAALYRSKGHHREALAVLWQQVATASEYAALVASGAPVLAGTSCGAAEVAALMFRWRALSGVAEYVRSAGAAAAGAALPYVARLLSGAFDSAGVALGLVALWPPAAAAPAEPVAPATATDPPPPLPLDPLDVCQLIVSGTSAAQLSDDSALRLWLLRGDRDAAEAVSGADSEAGGGGGGGVVLEDISSVEGAVLDEALFDERLCDLADVGPPTREARRRHLLIAYLENLVLACGYRGSQVATLLALQYVSVAQDAAARGGGGALEASLRQHAATGASSDEEAPPAEEDSAVPDEAGASGAAANVAVPGAEFLVLHFRARLLRLLMRPPAPCPCDASVVLRALPPRGFAEERVVLLRALGRHGAAIEVLVRDARDLDGAEAYCRAVSAGAAAPLSGFAPYSFLGGGGGSDGASTAAAGEGGGSVHNHFVRAALGAPGPEGSPEPSPETVSRVVRFVSENLASTDAAAAARLLPGATLLGPLTGFIERAVQHTHNTRRTLAISRQLAALQWQRARGILLQRQTGSRGGAFVVDRVTVCALCDRRLAPTGLVDFVRLPDGKLQHLACGVE